MINKKGFSLVELMAVLVILGVVFAIAIPSYNSYTKKARNALYSSYISNIKDATSAYLEECLRNNTTCSKLNDKYTYYTIRGHRIRDIDPNNLNVKIDNNKCSDANISIGFPTTTYKETVPNIKDFYVCLKCKSGNSYTELDTDDNECDELKNKITYKITYLNDEVYQDIFIEYGNEEKFSDSYTTPLYLKYIDVYVTGSKQLEPLGFRNRNTPIVICNSQDSCNKEKFTLEYDNGL